MAGACTLPIDPMARGKGPENFLKLQRSFLSENDVLEYAYYFHVHK